jgi:restriction system protein
MAVWLVRAGRSGEYENKFLKDNKIYLTWDGLNVDLSTIPDRQKLLQYLLEFYENEKKNTVRNWVGQIFPFAQKIQKSDWIVCPSKFKATIHIGEVIGDYVFNAKAEDPYYHSREVKWFARDIPRTNFDQDLLYSFGAFMTVCQIKRNNAEERLKEMKKNNWMPLKKGTIPKHIQDEVQDDENTMADLEQIAGDQIAKLLIQKFKGHGMAVIIESILKAKGYTTFRSPEGPDKGIDILAALAPMGFGKPRLCVQVKTQDNPVERNILDQLIGAMANFGADQGLLVSWGGFKNSIEKERASQFFKVRLWSQKEIIEEFLENYDKLSDEIKTEIPLKKIWTLSSSEEE